MRTFIALVVSLSVVGIVPARSQDTRSDHQGHEGHHHPLAEQSQADQSADDQEGFVGSGHAKWHDTFYKNLLRPDTKTSCCNMTDCRPTSGRISQGHYEIKVNGAWISVPQAQILPTAAPDGGYHVCAPLNFKGPPGELYCVVVAPEG